MNRGSLIDIFSKKSEVDNRYMKRYSPSLIIRKIQIKRMMRYHLIAVKMTVIKKKR